MKILFSILVWMAVAGAISLKVSEVEICSERVPQEFDGYKIVQISDLHVVAMTPKRYERLVRKIARLEADLIVNTGDLVTLSHKELTPEVADALGKLSAPDGVWNVWGNHDLGFYLRADSARLVQNFEELGRKVDGMGWRTLSDTSTWIRRGGDSILLTGVDFPEDGMHRGHNTGLAGADLEAAFEGVEGRPFNVVMAHTPQMWRRITERGRGDVALSGHTHAMQFKLLGWSPAQYLYKEWSGRYEDDKKNVLYVNNGIGFVLYPVRIGARPEITLFTLKRCE